MEVKILKASNAVCGHNGHELYGGEEGACEIAGVRYLWGSACPGCVAIELAEIRNNEQPSTTSKA